MRRNLHGTWLVLKLNVVSRSGLHGIHLKVNLPVQEIVQLIHPLRLSKPSKTQRHI